MKHTATHPSLPLGLACFILATSSAALSAVPVYNRPEAQAMQIGELESLDLAVEADWPQGVDPVPGWQPVYYRGAFRVYVDNDDIGKDLSPKPGAPYLMQPEAGAQRLAVATQKDQTEFLEVGSDYSLIYLETIVLGYLRQSASANRQPTASDAAGGGGKPSPSEAPPDAALPSKTLQGIVAKTSFLEKTRMKFNYKLVAPDGSALAYIDTDELPKFIVVSDYLNKMAHVSGPVLTFQDGSQLIIRARSLKKVN